MRKLGKLRVYEVSLVEGEDEDRPLFVKEAEDDKAQRIYRETHDSRGHYFNNPNRAQRRHIAASWKNKGKR